MMRLSKKQSVAWKYLEDKTTNEVLYGGAAGGGKSKLATIWHIYRRMTYPGTRGLIGRSKISNLEQSTLITLFETASQMGYQQGVHYNYNQQKHIITWSNQSVTVLKDLFLYPSDPDFTSLGSTEYTDAVIDETPEVTRKAKEIVSTRIRYKLDEFGLVPKLLMTCNPSPGWVKEDYICDDMGVPVELPENKKFVRAILSDNPNEEFRRLYESQLESMSSEYDKQRLLYGNWNVRDNILNPFATSWDQKKHVSDVVELNPSIPLFLSIDFNLNPFGLIAGHVFQDRDGWHCHIVDEIEIKQGSIPKMIEEIRLRYDHWLPSITITGDYMGARRDIAQVDNASYFDQIRRELRIHQRQIKLYPNPTHSNSRADVNYVLYNFPDFKIASKCKSTIFDMNNVECDAFGSIIKRDRKDLSQRADYLDCLRYFVHAFLHDWLKRHRPTK